MSRTPLSLPPHPPLPPGSPNDQAVNAALLAATGFFIGGPSSMISSAISADLGRQEALRGSQEALATVTGIVDGTGSIGAAGGQVKLKHWGKKNTEKNLFGGVHASECCADKTVSHSDPFCQYLVSLIEAKLGWMCVFYFFIVMVRRPHFCFSLQRLCKDSVPAL